MGILRAEPLKAQAWAARSASTFWRAYDFQLTTYAVLLTAFGRVMAFSNSGDADPLAANSTFARGLMWAGIAAVVFVVATAFDYKWLRTFAWPLYFFNLGLLVITLRFGQGTGDAEGAARWITIGGFQFQFSELAKIIMIIVLANYLTSHQKTIKSIWTLIGAFVLVGPAWVLVMRQPDLGTSLVFAAILLGMVFMAGASLLWLTAFLGAAAAAIPFVWTYLLHDYQKARLLAFLDPSSDPQAGGYQLLQSQIAVGSGGWFGKGLTNGTIDLPVQTTDFVWAVLAEELGFMGSLVVLALFIALLWRVLVSAWRAPDQFSMLIAVGIASMILFQLFVNVGMVIGLMPVTGIPLPFVTHGGASLVSLAAGLGLLQGVGLRRHKLEW